MRKKIIGFKSYVIFGERMKKPASFSMLSLVLIASLAFACDIQEVSAEQREAAVEVSD